MAILHIKRIGILAILAILTAAPLSAEFRKITKFGDLQKLVIDKKLVSEKGYWFTLTKDTRIVGDVQGKKMQGNWVWGRRFVCRSFTIGTKEYPPDCVTLAIEGNSLLLRSGKGRGQPEVFTIE
jgi:hypothetical protein